MPPKKIEYWVCNRCTYKNATKKLCSMCRAPKGTPAPPKQRRTPVKEPPAKAKSTPVSSVKKADPRARTPPSKTKAPAPKPVSKVTSAVKRVPQSPRPVSSPAVKRAKPQPPSKTPLSAQKPSAIKRVTPSSARVTPASKRTAVAPPSRSLSAAKRASQQKSAKPSAPASVKKSPQLSSTTRKKEENRALAVPRSAAKVAVSQASSKAQGTDLEDSPPKMLNFDDLTQGTTLSVSQKSKDQGGEMEEKAPLAMESLVSQDTITPSPQEVQSVVPVENTELNTQAVASDVNPSQSASEAKVEEAQQAEAPSTIENPVEDTAVRMQEDGASDAVHSQPASEAKDDEAEAPTPVEYVKEDNAAPATESDQVQKDESPSQIPKEDKESQEEIHVDQKSDNTMENQESQYASASTSQLKTGEPNSLPAEKESPADSPLSARSSVSNKSDISATNAEATDMPMAERSAMVSMEITESREFHNDIYDLIAEESPENPSLPAQPAPASPTISPEPNFRMATGEVISVPQQAVLAAAKKFDVPLPEGYEQKAHEQSPAKGTVQSEEQPKVISHTSLQFHDPSTPSRTRTQTEMPTDEVPQSLNMSPAAPAPSAPTPLAQTDEDSDEASPDARASVSIVEDGSPQAQSQLPSQYLEFSQFGEEATMADKTDASEPEPEDESEPQFRTAVDDSIIDIPEKDVIASAERFDLPLPPKYSSQEFLEKRELERAETSDDSPAVIRVSKFVFKPPQKHSFRRTPAPTLGSESPELKRVSKEAAALTADAQPRAASIQDNLEALTTYEVPDYKPISPIRAERLPTVPQDDAIAPISIAESPEAEPSDLLFRTAGSNRVIPVSNEAVVRAARKYDLPIPQALRAVDSTLGPAAGHAQTAKAVSPTFVTPFATQPGSPQKGPAAPVDDSWGLAGTAEN